MGELKETLRQSPTTLLVPDSNTGLNVRLLQESEALNTQLVAKHMLSYMALMYDNAGYLNSLENAANYNQLWTDNTLRHGIANPAEYPDWSMHHPKPDNDFRGLPKAPVGLF